MQTRRDLLARSATIAGLLATAGLLPQAAHAAWAARVMEGVMAR